jgi:thymidine phosphorylase
MGKRPNEFDANSTDDEIVAFINWIKTEYPADPSKAAEIARVLASSGEVILAKSAFTADVASTGGPSSLSTLLCPLFLRAAGGIVPKLSVPGRPAGGIDCLMQVDGYKVSFEIGEIEDMLATVGYVHILAGGRLAPLDSRLFRLRQQHGAQDVPTLVAGSLLSKKLAAGVRQAGLDVRVAPHGNFGITWEEARKNAMLFIDAARLLSIDAYPVLTDARYPYQPFIGRREALLALSHIFNSTASSWLEEHYRTCRDLALVCTPHANRQSLILASRTDLRKHFNINMLSQGASGESFDRIAERTLAQHIHVLSADRDGFVQLSLDGIRRVLVSLQKANENPDLMFPDPLGLILLRRQGEWVEEGEPLATVRIDCEIHADVIRDLEPFICRMAARPLGTSLEGIASDE